MTVRAGMRHRWQTKRGLTGRERSGDIEEAATLRVEPEACFESEAALLAVVG